MDIKRRIPECGKRGAHHGLFCTRGKGHVGKHWAFIGVRMVTWAERDVRKDSTIPKEVRAHG